MYLPSMSLVWASKAGMAPKKIKLMGNKSHWRAIQSHLNFPYCGGFSGNKIILIMADVTKPSKAIFIMALVIRGKL